MSAKIIPLPGRPVKIALSEEERQHYVECTRCKMLYDVRRAHEIKKHHHDVERIRRLEGDNAS